MEKTLFEKIVDGQIPSVKLFEDDVCIVIMDKFPTTRGQCLIIPKDPVSYAFDLDDETYLYLFSVAKKVAKALDKALQPIRTCLVVEGFEVPHTHIKLYPVYEEKLVTSGGEMADDSLLEDLADKIKGEL